MGAICKILLIYSLPSTVKEGINETRNGSEIAIRASVEDIDPMTSHEQDQLNKTRRGFCPQSLSSSFLLAVSDCGRLGNALSQYAAVIGLAKLAGATPVISPVGQIYSTMGSYVERSQYK